MAPGDGSSYVNITDNFTRRCVIPCEFEFISGARAGVSCLAEDPSASAKISESEPSLLNF